MSKVNISLGNLTDENMGLFNKITSPTEYSESYIKDAKNSVELAQYAYFSEVPVGVVVSKPLQPANSQSPIGLCIEVLDVLRPYRNHGIENKLLSHIEETAKDKRHLSSVFALIDSQDAFFKDFLQEKGYVIESRDADIYKGLDLKDGNKVFLKKELS